MSEGERLFAANYDSSDVHLRTKRTSRPDASTYEGSTVSAAALDRLERSPSETTPSSEPSVQLTASSFDSGSPVARPSRSHLDIAINLYFKYCHRQPIWCFDREELGDCASIPDELVCSMLALVSRFSDHLGYSKSYGKKAKAMIMLRIANGTVDLIIIESLCLLAYTSFIGTRISFPPIVPE